jgi:multisubunit Na+/H+ antiporter MnhB subunit
MADTTQTKPPEMDYAEHERTYASFMHFSEVGLMACLGIVASLALGGGKHAWIACIIGVILTLAACVIGLASRSLSWKPGAAVLALLLVLLALL